MKRPSFHSGAILRFIPALGSAFVIVLATAFLAMAFLTIAPLNVSAEPKDPKAVPTGTIKGTVLDAETQMPVIGTTIRIESDGLPVEKATATDTAGNFVLNNVPVGSYVVHFMSVGYMPKAQTDVIVRSRRITFLSIELVETVTEIQGQVVTAGYFNDVEDEATSATSFSGEEIRRAPGSAGDVSRIVSVLPSVAKVNDQLNSLVVRGGSPSENAFYIDNIEIPNINHFPLQGTSGGPISMVNVDFVRDVTFSAGGFGAAYGDRLSSVMDIEYRDGNRDEVDMQLDMNFAGFGAVGEGPIDHGKGAWIFSARRSYLDLIVDAIGTGIAPRYGDINAKATYDFSPSSRLTWLAVGGVDEVKFDSAEAVDDNNVFYGNHKGYEYATGFNWRQIWGEIGYSNTSISMLGTQSKATFFEIKSVDTVTTQNTTEMAFQLRNVNDLRLGRNEHLQLGFDVKQNVNDYDYMAAEFTNIFGDTIPELIVDRRISSPQLGCFASLTVHPAASLTTTFGVRGDYFEYNKHSHVSPRFAATLQLTERTALNAAAGVYYQNLPLVLLSQKEEFKDLKDPVSYHYVFGVSHLLAEATKLTVEAYYKDYDRFPIDPDQPELFISDDIAFSRTVGLFENLESTGEAKSYGLEVTLQKKLARDFYGLVSGSLFKARYRDGNRIWRDRVFDNRRLFSVEGGYKPNRSWEFSLRWVYAGGSPYTPIDLEASRAINRTVKDRVRVNDVRYPDYHSLNVRFDRRFNFSGSSLILYLSVWNAYNRKNVAEYYWNEADQKQDVTYQWTLIPLLGLEYEF